MICPNCHYEYVLGVTICPDCGADLVYALPPKSATFNAPKGAELSSDVVIIYETDIGVDLAIAKEILDEAGIPYLVGRKPGISYSEHTMIIQVSTDEAERARSLLSELAEGGSRLIDNVEMEEGAEDTLDSNVTVFEPGDKSELSAARAILNKAGIDYDVVDKSDYKFTRHISVEIQVNKSQADKARKLLSELKRSTPPPKE